LTKVDIIPQEEMASPIDAALMERIYKVIETKARHLKRWDVTSQTQNGPKHEKRTIKRETVGDFSFLFFST